MDFFKKVFLTLKKNNRLIKIFLLLFALTTVIYLVQAEPSKVKVRAGNCNFEVELAKIAKEQYQGLSRRENLAKDQGMLFLFNEKKERTFVMRDMYFSLDIIFIKDGKVIKLYQNLSPERAEPQRFYESGTEVDAVLEIGGGLSRSCAIGLGTEITW